VRFCVDFSHFVLTTIVTSFWPQTRFTFLLKTVNSITGLSTNWAVKDTFILSQECGL
jgi:hypothetical protein